MNIFYAIIIHEEGALPSQKSRDLISTVKSFIKNNILRLSMAGLGVITRPH